MLTERAISTFLETVSLDFIKYRASWRNSAVCRYLLSSYLAVGQKTAQDNKH
jgi:hypothetical protein